MLLTEFLILLASTKNAKRAKTNSITKDNVLYAQLPYHEKSDHGLFLSAKGNIYANNTPFRAALTRPNKVETMAIMTLSKQRTHQFYNAWKCMALR